ncbi:MAG TPA: hypothetical protein VE974_22805 [Thermoanaerobaculia bacterium]|nr:hypothetical protein [Thermoanaerobaculia bacterium]
MESGGTYSTRKQRYAVAIATVILALTRFAALSKTPWDWDEVLFSLALNDYNVGAHYPHPPGFPLYIVLGRIARIFTDTDFHALQTINVIAGMLAFPVMYWVARTFRIDFHGALAAGIVFAILPNVWFYGGTAFSDVPAMILFLASVGAYMSSVAHAEDDPAARRYYLGALLLSAGVLFRPQNAVVAVFPWTIATIRFVRAKRWGTVLGASLLIVALVAIGYGGAIAATGVDAYIAAFQAHSAYIRIADAYSAAVRPPLWEVALIQLDPYEAGKVSLLMNLLAAVAILDAAIRRKGRPALEVLLTFGPFFLFAMLSTNPLGSSRFSLNYIAGIVLLAVQGTVVLGRLVSRLHPRAAPALRIAFVAIIVGRLVTWELSAFEVPRTTASPPVAAAMWVRENVPLTDVVFVDDSIWPWMSYYAPKHRQVRPVDTLAIIKHPDAARGWYVGNGPTSAHSAVRFRRPYTRLWNIVTKRNFESYVQPSASVVKFGEGWYGQEGDIHYSWRWAKQRSLMLLAPTPREAELRIVFTVPLEAMKAPVTVTFRLNGHVVATVPVTRRENEVRYVLTGHHDQPNRLIIEVSDVFIPARRGELDDRELAFMLRDITWNRL